MYGLTEDDAASLCVPMRWPGELNKSVIWRCYIESLSLLLDLRLDWSMKQCIETSSRTSCLGTWFNQLAEWLSLPTFVEGTSWESFSMDSHRSYSYQFIEYNIPPSVNPLQSVSSFLFWSRRSCLFLKTTTPYLAKLCASCSAGLVYWSLDWCASVQT